MLVVVVNQLRSFGQLINALGGGELWSAFIWDTVEIKTIDSPYKINLFIE